MKPSLFASLIAVLPLLSGCEKAPEAKAPSAQEEPSYSFRGFKVRASHEGLLTWEAHAERAKVYQGARRAEAEGVTMTYFEKGRPVSWAEADRANIGLDDYDVKARGHVKVRGHNGVVLTTNQLDWDNQKQLATSQSKVRVERKGSVLTGWGLSADRALQDVRILRDVSAEAESVKGLRQENEELRK